MIGSTKIQRVGTKIYGQTLMAVVGNDFPHNFGNYFSLRMQNGSHATVQNISAEDFEEICKLKNLITVEVLHFVDTDYCYVIDSRIPRSWFREVPNNDKKEHHPTGDDHAIVGYTGKVTYNAGVIIAPHIPDFKDTDKNE